MEQAVEDPPAPLTVPIDRIQASACVLCTHLSSIVNPEIGNGIEEEMAARRKRSICEHCAATKRKDAIRTLIRKHNNSAWQNALLKMKDLTSEEFCFLLSRSEANAADFFAHNNPVHVVMLSDNPSILAYILDTLRVRLRCSVTDLCRYALAEAKCRIVAWLIESGRIGRCEVATLLLDICAPRQRSLHRLLFNESLDAGIREM